jgi:hypothetical protein
MFPVDDIYPGVGDPNAPHPATFGPLGDVGNGIRCAGLIVHTTEAAGYSRATALATAKWQTTNPGSYNWIIYDGGLVLTVPYLEASGGINPSSSAWAPKAWLTQQLGAKVMGDPARFQLQVAFSGKAADFAAGRNPANMIDTAARLVIWIESQPWGADNLILSAHADYQTNRSDPGAGVIDRILKRYAEIKNPPAPVVDCAGIMAELESTKQQVAAQAEIIARQKTDLATANAKIAAARSALA